MKKNILHISPFYSPNIGGVETHLTDLIKKLDSLGYKNLVLTYSPITCPHTAYKKHEKNKNTTIRRFPWFGHNLFHKLEKRPVINFFYITPYLFIRSFIYLLIHRPQINTVHSHGLNASLISSILVKIFHIKKHVTSLYSTYDNVNPSQKINSYITTILNSSDQVLIQSQQSLKQLQKMGVKNLSRYRHWIDLNRFSPKPKNKKFSVLFVGRMIPQKGAYLLAKTAFNFPQIQFNLIGQGPDYKKIKKLKQKNIKLLGNINYQKLHQYYQKNHILIVPSLYQEGWGRVAMEAVASGTPVIASNRGALTELLDSSIAILINPNLKNLKTAIKKFSQNKTFYQKIQKNCRPYAQKNFGSKNIILISQHY